MATHFYLIPRTTVTGGPGGSFFAPKYVHPADLNLPFSAMDYGRDGTFLVGCDVTPAQHTTIAANSDVTAIPANLDAAIGTAGALTAVQNALEALRIPALWVTTAHTYRQVVGAVGRIFLLMQRFAGVYKRTFFEAGITLGTRMNQLTTGQRAALEDAISKLGELLKVP